MFGGRLGYENFFPLARTFSTIFESTSGAFIAAQREAMK
jgi:hypothetical protein